MRKLLGFTTLAALALALLAAPLTSTNVYAGGATSTTTGQGIMVNLHRTGQLAIHNNEVYAFNEATAAGYFSNALTSGPSVSCAGSPTNCSVSNQPAAPAAPAPDSNQVIAPPGNPGGQGAIFQNKCTFLDGGTLTGRTYTQSVTVSGLNTKGFFTFTWTYNVTPSPDPVAPFTAWDLVATTGDGTADVTLHADIAGESAMSSSKHTLKYSFSLLDGDGISNRVSDLAITVDGGAPIPATSQIVANAPGALPGDPGAVDFNYTTNAGSNGSIALLANGDARAILNNDSFAGNNNGGADGQALAYASMDGVHVSLAPGAHSVTLTGTVKGNSASAAISFSVNQTISIITPGCGGGQ